MQKMTRGEAYKLGVDRARALGVLNGRENARSIREVLASWQIVASDKSLYNLDGGFFGRQVYELGKEGLLEI